MLMIVDTDDKNHHSKTKNKVEEMRISFDPKPLEQEMNNDWDKSDDNHNDHPLMPMDMAEVMQISFDPKQLVQEMNNDWNKNDDHLLMMMNEVVVMHDQLH